MTNSIEKLRLALETASNVIDKAWNENVFKADAIAREERNNICVTCEEFTKENRKCKVCGCYMDLKIPLIAAKCPIKKW